MKEYICYGGPIHGQSVKSFDGCEYLVPRRPVLDIRWKCTDRVERPTFDVTTYRVQTCSYRAILPSRTKTYKFLLADGYKLTRHDCYTLEMHLLYQPWVFPSVSFIHDFDEWFAQTVYKHTKTFYWKGKRVWEQLNVSGW